MDGWLKLTLEDGEPLLIHLPTGTAIATTTAPAGICRLEMPGGTIVRFRGYVDDLALALGAMLLDAGPDPYVPA